jgi:hypothetical protein
MVKENYPLLQATVRAYMKTLDRDTCRKQVSIVDKGVTCFLTQNFKTKKGGDKFYNIGLELLPSSLSGKNLCGKEGACKFSCLAFTGQNVRKHTQALLTNANDPEGAIRNRAIRSWLYIHDNAWFMERLEMEIRHHQNIAKFKGVVFAVRLNVFSDIDFRAFTSKMPDIQFYDYTKFWERESTENYHLTFSYSEKTSVSDAEVKIAKGENVAVVLIMGKKAKGKTWKGMPMIDGDLDDARYTDPKGSIVGLKIKYTSLGKTDFENKFLKSAVA